MLPNTTVALFASLCLTALVAASAALVAPHRSPRWSGRRAVGNMSLRTSREVGGDDGVASPPSVDELERVKSELVGLCTAGDSTRPSVERVNRMAEQVEALGRRLGIGQESSRSGLLAGEWELLYSPEDDTRSSPFFWAFRRAFPNQSDQIFGITDSIPFPLKEIGPATQTIELETLADTSGDIGGYNNDRASGTLVSRVRVSTLGGTASSIMTTRCKIQSSEGIDGLRLVVTSTKPEDSTLLQKLGPLGSYLNDNAPPFPSGDALERVMPGSSEVVMRTTYCDEALRISRNDERYDLPFVWRRKSFGRDGTMGRGGNFVI